MSVIRPDAMETDMHGHALSHCTPVTDRHLFKLAPPRSMRVYKSVVSCPLLWINLMMDWTTSDVVP